MPRGAYLNPSGFPKEAVPELTRTFYPAPDKPVTLTLRALLAPGKLEATALAEELQADYLGHKPRLPLPALSDGSYPEVSPSLLKQIAFLYTMEQVDPEQGEQKMAIEDWIAFASCAGDFFLEVAAFAGEVLTQGTDAEGNAAGPAEAGLSEPQPATPAATPKSSTSKTPRSRA